MLKGSITKYLVKGSSRPKWRFRLFAGLDAGGKQIRIGAGGFAKEADARKAMQARIAEIERERNMPTAPPLATGISVAQWLAEWLTVHAVRSCERKTLSRYRQLAAYVTSPDAPSQMIALAQTPLTGIRRAQFKTALFALATAKAQRRERLSGRTVLHVRGVISAALNEAVEQELIPANPMAGLKLKLAPKRGEQRARALTAIEIPALRQVCLGDWTFSLIEIGLASGMRRGELLAVTWPDIDFATAMITVSKSLEQTPEDGLRVKTTKSGETRRLQLSRGAITTLKFLRDQQAEQKRLFGSDYQDHGLIFAQPNGDFLDPALVSQTVVRRMKKAKITGASFHTLRHTHASHLLSRGVPLAAVSARLGHADPSITARIYSHAIPTDDARAAQEWDGFVDELRAVEELDTVIGLAVQ